jgi:hypothetical protein
MEVRMKGSSRRWFVRVFWVALLMGAVSAALYATHSWGNYHWARKSNPFTLKLGDNVSSAWDAYLAETSSDWSDSSVLDTTVVAGGTSARRCKPTSGRVEVCSERYGYNGWLGLAQIWASGSHITQAVTKMNDSYFNSGTYNTPAWRRLVMCQEVGHTFGLDHQDEDFNNPNLGTCMDYTSNPEGNGHPNLHDFQQLETIYAHLDSTTTVGQTVEGPGNGKMPPAMNEIDLSGPGQWGRLVKGSPELGFSVHELDFGGGHKVFTFVFWVRPDHHRE